MEACNCSSQMPLGGRLPEKKEIGMKTAQWLIESLGSILIWACEFTRSPNSALLLFFGEGSPTKIDYRKKGTLILTSLLEDLRPPVT